MSPAFNPPLNLARIVPRDVQGYVRTRGWVPFRPIGRLMVYNRSESDSLDQVLVPIDSSRPDYVERVGEAVEKLAEFETRTETSIVTDLLNFDSDILRYRVASQRAERGTLPLTQALDLLAGAKQSITAAAHSALVPQKYHPKLRRTEAMQLLDRCQLNQTEQNSFVVAIGCPMRAVDSDEAGLPPGGEPFARRTTSLLFNALASLDAAIEQDSVNRIVDAEQPIVSANLCSALLKMRPQQDDGLLEFIPSWAPSTPNTSALHLPRSIVFNNDEFDAIEDVHRQLRPTEGPQDRPWLAIVDELKGTELVDGGRQGEVVFSLFDGDEVVRARASLDREQYQTAYEAHNPPQPLYVFGVLHRGPRVSRLSDLTKIERLPINLDDAHT